MLFDDNKIKMARRPGKENPVWCTGKVNLKRKYKRSQDGNRLGGDVTVVRLALTRVSYIMQLLNLQSSPAKAFYITAIDTKKSNKMVIDSVHFKDSEVFI